jgi:hypothetical protein
LPQPSKIPLAFAASGDKNIIPESTETTGLASWRDGFPAITSTPFSEGGIAPKRADFNGIFNALSAAALWYQQGGIFVYDNATNYEIGNLVIYSGEIYVCKTANGPASALHSPANDTAETYWGRIYPQNGTFDRMYFSQSSGSYTAPATGVYRITLKGGGGGGGWHGTSGKVGGAGGEGGEMTFYKTLTKNTSYSYAIGAGGAAPSAAGDEGAVGGATSFNSGEYSIDGGGRGRNPTSTAYAGGQGGYNAVVPAGTAVYVRPGQSGEPGGTKDTYSLGGGCAPNNGGVARLGAGGRGGGPDTSSGTAGANGFILIEYAG